jgi:hypothetical protein
MLAVILFGMMAPVATPAYAQGGGATSSLTGIVTDASGAVIPGADVKAKHVGTSAEFVAVTSDNGEFHIPTLQPGAYTVTVSLMGFKTFVANDVVLNAGVPRSLRVTLEVGTLQETVTVQAGTEIVQTRSSSVATTINVNQISNLPLVSRNALDSVVFLAGVNTPAGNRDSTINGLPQSAINITLDGASIQDNYLKSSDGFFARLSPRLDAVEEVTVTTAANSSDTAGQGAVAIRFTTRSGTNRYTGSAYHYYRNDGLNSNTWFNNRDLPVDPKTGKAPKNDLLQNQPGARFGGPVIIPGLFNGRDKAFFFVNYEQSRTPSKITRERRLYSPDAQAGVFRYQGGSPVNLFALAAKLGVAAPADPTVAKVLADIRSASGQGSIQALTDPNLDRATFQLESKNITPYPTVRFDYNVSEKHRLMASFNYQHIDSNPDTTNNREPVFPGFSHTGSQQSTRYSTSNSLRSTLTSTLVNEFRAGATGGATYFSPELNPSMWSGVPDQGGFHLNFNTAAGIPTAAGVHNPASTSAFSAREASTKFVENAMDWVKGSHTIRFGGAWTQVDLWLKNQTLVPTIDFGIATGDPAEAMFTTANFPGASTTNLNNARALFAILTGRVTGIGGTSRLNEATDAYEYLGIGMQRARMRELGFFIQDSWRWKPNLTVNYGLRYELQYPFYPLNNSYLTATMDDICGVSGTNPQTGCTLFQPGVRGPKPTFQRFAEGTRAFATDTNNWAPSLGINWTPDVESGILRAVFGEPGDTSFRAAYSLGFNRNGMSDFSDVFGSNPGVSITSNRNQSLGNLGGVPVFFTNRGALGAPPVPENLTLPYTEEPITGDINIFDPNLEVPYSQTWTAGWQRKITTDVAVEVRYVGTRHLQSWTEYNFNEANVVENGFLDEFRRAQANLQANIAAGRGNSFKYFGPGTGTSPLPIYLAYLVGSSDANTAAAYTGTTWTNTNWTNPLAIYNPNPFTPAGTNSNTGLDGNTDRRANAARAGLPSNFFRVNPDLQGGANMTGNGGYTKYNGLQLEVRKRLSHGFQVQGNYTYGHMYESNRFSFRTDRELRLVTGTLGGVTHSFKADWTIELPFGRGRAFASNAGPVLDRIVGGWAFYGTARVQTGRLINLGNVRLVGISAKDVQDFYTLRFDDAGRVIYMMPQDVIDETIKAFSVSATSATGYGSLGAPSGRYFAPANGPDCIEIAGTKGDCGVGDLVVTGPRLVRFDLSAVKRVPIVGRVTGEFRAEMLNAFNHPYFTPVGGIGSNPDSYRVTAADSGRTIQLVTRVSW